MKGIRKMNARKIMAKLYANVNLSASEYIMQSVFSEMENTPETVEALERFHLPEITKFICCSDTILSLKWAKKYRPLHDYCMDRSPTNLLEDILLPYESMENGIAVFEEDFLSTEYTPIIQKLCDQVETLYQKIDSQKAEIHEKTTKIEKISQEISSLSDDAETDMDSADNEKSSADSSERRKTFNCLLKELKDLEEELRKNETFVEKFSQYFLVLNRYCQLLSDDEINRRRQEAYQSLEATSKLSDEEKFVSSYIKSGIVTDEYREKLLNDDFCCRYLKILEQEDNRSIAIAFLVYLHIQAEIDIESDIYKNFLIHHAELLVPYLRKEYNKTTDFTADDTNQSLLEILLNAVAADEKIFDYSQLFNEIQETETWQYILDFSLTFNNKCQVIARLLNGLCGKPVQYMLDSISSVLVSDRRISVHDICEELLHLSEKNSGMALRLIGLLEQNQRKVQRKLNTTERIVKSQSQEIFSSLYVPMQDLENLTASIKDTKKEIDCNLIAGKLFTVVEAFRTGLTALGVDTVEDFDLWRRRSRVSYDPQRHKVFLTDNLDDISEVKIRTLGFSYRDEDDTENKVLAEVCIDEITPDEPQPKKKGYPKESKIKFTHTLKGIKSLQERNKKNKKLKK